MNSVLMVVSMSGNFHLMTIPKRNSKQLYKFLIFTICMIGKSATENSFRAEDEDEYCFVQRGPGLGASVDCQVKGDFYCKTP